MKKLVKVIKIGGGLGINLPKLMTETLGLTSNDKVEVEYDFKKNQLVIKKKEEK